MVVSKEFLFGLLIGCARAQAILYFVVVVPILLSRGHIPSSAWFPLFGLLVFIFSATCLWAFLRYRSVSVRVGNPPGWGLLSEYQRGLAAARIGLSLG